MWQDISKDDIVVIDDVEQFHLPTKQPTQKINIMRPLPVSKFFEWMQKRGRDLGEEMRKASPGARTQYLLIKSNYNSR